MLPLRLGAVALLGFLLTGMVLAQDGPAGGGDKKNKPGPAPSGGPLKFDVDAFIRHFDRNGDGFLQRDEVPDWLRDRFDLLDTNHDGKLSRDELHQGVVHLQPRRRPSDVVFVLIEMSDFDDECAAELQRLYDALRPLDINHDGKIDAGELKAMRQRLLEERVGRLMQELDTDHDGKISRAEARGRVKEDFDKIDANHDGFIDRAELLRAATEHIHPPAKDGRKR
jgi:Ca2+-binding EF-hand superfamily protein